MAMIGEPAAFAPLVRAMVLDTRGASEALSAAIAHVPSDAQTRVRVHSVVDAKGEQGLARWRAAFARAEGAHEAAREALREAVNAGESAAARPLLDAAIEDCDSQALNAALRAISVDDSDALLADARRLAHALSVDRDRSAEALDAIALVTDSRVSPWAERIAGDIARAWIPASGAPAAWVPLLARLDTHAHSIGDLTSAARVGALSAERSRPVVLAVVGEFNAGKSTFINALIGADIAPTGVLPTTATLHHLRWAPDPFAKVIFATGHDPSERIVALGELRATLAGLDTAAIRRVEIRLPLASLVAVEILDTPGFNAPDARHASVARSAFDEADVAIWLLDATQAIKQSERAVLEEAQRAKLPVQMFVNKSDRLSPKDLQKVMDGVSAALAETEISSWRPPLPFSAKRALAGKLGDAAALEDSGWRAVQALLEDQIVARSDELKERALRRRASSVVGELVAAWRTKIDVERAQAHEASDRAHRAAQVAARIDRDADTTASQLATSLAPHAEAWKRDLELVFIGRDPEAAARDSVLERYRVERALESIAPALARALASLASEAGLTPAQIGPIARAIVRAAASCAPPDIDAMLAGSARAAVATLIEQLSALSVAPSPPTRAGGILRELQAFAAALG
jgi:GTP-binding protein EngB required for normal cell division